MGTNYYARVIPTKERRDRIKECIDCNDFDGIKSLVAKTYYAPSYDFEDCCYVGGEIHLGKRSGGWKFLWNPNWYRLVKGHTEWEEIEGGRGGHWVDDGFDVFKYYDLTKESIKCFIDRDDVEIYDEYGDKQDKEEFWDMAIGWGYGSDSKGWDGESYEEWEKKQNPNYRSFSYETDYSRFLIECGFELNRYGMDFYSDGMRFATCTEFS